MSGSSSDFSAFDVHAKGVRKDAESKWACMRAQERLARSEALGGFYLVSRFSELRQALLDWELFSSASGITIPDQGVRSRHIPAEFDPPLHKEYRTIMARHFTPERVNAMAPRVREIARALFDRFAGRAHVDFVDVLARPLPVHVSLHLLGVDESDAEMLDRFVVALHEEVAIGVRTGAADMLTAYVREALVTRAPRASAGDDTLVSSIITGKVEGRPLTLDEQISMVRLILIGGFDSTAIALATAAWWLAGNPSDFAKLRADAAAIDGFCEDIVRYASPATYLRRTVTRDVEFGGTELRAGDRVVLCFGAANRDPTQFPDPDMVQADRKPTHLGFGFGAHRCIGSWVAKLEMRIVVEELLARYGSIQPDPGLDVSVSSGLNQGIVGLPLLMHPAT